jgi:putative component of membrane protein insertase Oxa1/YidC/SpoIIIJ protein YidD
MRAIVVFLIGLYQRYLSPYKGYRCAHAVCHQGLSCSAAVKDIVATHGVLRGLPLVRQRFAECSNAALALRLQSQEEGVGEPEDRKKKRRRRCEVDECDDGPCNNGDGLCCAAAEAPGGDCQPGECNSGDGDCSHLGGLRLPFRLRRHGRHAAQ